MRVLLRPIFHRTLTGATMWADVVEYTRGAIRRAEEYEVVAEQAKRHELVLAQISGWHRPIPVIAQPAVRHIIRNVGGKLAQMRRTTGPPSAANRNLG